MRVNREDYLLGRYEQTSTHPRQGTEDRPKSTLVNQASGYIGVICRDMGGITYRCRNDSKTGAYLPKLIPSMSDSHKSQKPGVYYSLQAAQRVGKC